jgi:hypothetical protein
VKFVLCEVWKVVFASSCLIAYFFEQWRNFGKYL